MNVLINLCYYCDTTGWAMLNILSKELVCYYFNTVEWAIYQNHRLCVALNQKHARIFDLMYSVISLLVTIMYNWLIITFNHSFFNFSFLRLTIHRQDKRKIHMVKISRIRTLGHQYDWMYYLWNIRLYLIFVFPSNFLLFYH